MLSVDNDANLIGNYLHCLPGDVGLVLVTEEIQEVLHHLAQEGGLDGCILLHLPLLFVQYVECKGHKGAIHDAYPWQELHIDDAKFVIGNVHC